VLYVVDAVEQTSEVRLLLDVPYWTHGLVICS